MVGDADKANLSSSLGSQRRFIEAVLPAEAGTEGRIMKLDDIHIVGTQVAKAGLQIPVEPLRRERLALGGNVNLAADIGQGRAQLFLAV